MSDPTTGSSSITLSISARDLFGCADAVSSSVTQSLGDNDTDQGLAAEVHTNARAWFDERFVAREDAIIKESVERHRQSHAHHPLVRGIVRIGRRQAVEKGGRHGEIVWRARARGKATRTGRR